MSKLLRAGFARLRKNSLFWLLTVFSIAIALFMIYGQYSDMKEYGEVIEVEQLMLNYSTITGVVIAVFTSLFLGTEYSDGVIRNKISTGHKRSDIYLSNLIIISATSLFSYVIFIITVAAVGIPLFGGITLPIHKLLIIIGCIFAAVIAFSGIFTFLSMTISKKEISAVVCLLLAFGLMMGAMICLNITETQKYIEAGSLVDGEMVFEEVPNPRYPTESERAVYETLLKINPAGQMFQLAGRVVPDYKVLPIYSLGESIIFTLAGILVFGKKDLK